MAPLSTGARTTNAAFAITTGVGLKFQVSRSAFGLSCVKICSEPPKKSCFAECAGAIATGTAIGIGVATIVNVSVATELFAHLWAWGHGLPSSHFAAQESVAPPPLKGSTLDYLDDYLPSELGVISVFERATQSVAFVTTYMVSLPGISLNPMETPAGTGSGIVWYQEGRIVTNFHVIRDAIAAKITLANKKTYDAELVGTSADDDVAVLKINAPRKDSMRGYTVLARPGCG